MGQTEFSSLYRVCITCSAVISLNLGLFMMTLIFTALHGMQTQSSDEEAVHLYVHVHTSVPSSVCLSNARIVTKRKKDLSRFLYHTKYHLA